MAALGNSSDTWDYSSSNDGKTCQSLKDKNILYPMRKMLGGSSTNNFMAYVRGSPDYFDSWAQSVKDTTWNFTNVLNYFKKSERLQNLEIHESNTSELHSTNGSIGITRPRWSSTKKYLQAFTEYGLNYMTDHNGIDQIGCAEQSFTIADHMRQSTDYTYIRPIKNRKNLYISL